MSIVRKIALSQLKSLRKRIYKKAINDFTTSRVSRRASHLDLTALCINANKLRVRSSLASNLLTAGSCAPKFGVECSSTFDREGLIKSRLVSRSHRRSSLLVFEDAFCNAARKKLLETNEQNYRPLS